MTEPKTTNYVCRRQFFGGALAGAVGGGLVAWFTQRATQRYEEQFGMNLAGLDHAHFMRRAIAQAKNVPNLPFGAVIVDSQTQETRAEGHNRSNVNPTYHGEIDAINRCAADHPQIDWKPLVLYTTAEPCPMCQSAILWAGIGAVVFGTSIEALKKMGWWQIDISAAEVTRRANFRHCTVLGGIFEQECNALFLEVPRGRFREKSTE